jgi:hypothetical protein
VWRSEAAVGIVVYADFNCPECYLAARRVDVLAAAGVPVDFRAAEHGPELPVTGLRSSVAEQDSLIGRFGVLEDLLLPGEQRRSPYLVGRPSAAWVSQIGGAAELDGGADGPRAVVAPGRSLRSWVAARTPSESSR